MNLYELVYIARSDLTEAQVKELNNLIKTIVESGSGNKIELVDTWGVRSLAYRSKTLKKNKGFYTLTRLSLASPEVLVELRHKLQLNESVLRFIIKRVKNFENCYSPTQKAQASAEG